jgi:hypothetical protein
MRTKKQLSLLVFVIFSRTNLSIPFINFFFLSNLKATGYLSIQTGLQREASQRVNFQNTIN